MEENKIYEVGFMISPSISEEEVSQIVSKIESAITSNGGNIFDGETPKLRRLAYPIYKTVRGAKIVATTGFFGWTKFELPAEKSFEVEKAVRSIDEVLRSLMIKTIREKTYEPKEIEPELEQTEEILDEIPAEIMEEGIVDDVSIIPTEVVEEAKEE